MAARNASSSSRPSSADPSADLLHRWQDEADLDALDDLLRREVSILKELIQRKARGMLRPSAGATDVAHESVLALLKVKEPPAFDDPRALRAYLWKSAWRLLMQRMRRPRAAALLRPEAVASLSENATVLRLGGMGRLDHEERMVATRVAMTLLKDEERRLLEHFYFDEWPIAKAATELGISEEAAAMRLSRARRRLAQRLVAWHDAVA